MAFFQPESFYETTIASAITATASTIPVTTAPTITSGYLVIEANTSNREIIKYTGVSGTNLTGCVRGLATYGSDDSAGTGTTHSAGVDIANKDVHYYYAQYFDFLTGTSASGYNTLKFGDGNTTSAANRLIYLNTSSVSAFFGLSASGTFVISEDGTNSYVVSAGGSGVTAGDGIDITGGSVTVNKLSTGGLQISAGKLKVGYDGDTLKSTSAGEVYLDKTADYTWTGKHEIKNGTYIDADEVIAVSTVSKVVKTTSAGNVYMISSGSSTTTFPYVGFVTTAASAAGTQVFLQTNGIVDGFSGLTPGATIYAAGEAGEISETVGTVECKVGEAISDTEILIGKGSWEYVGTDTLSNTSSESAEASDTSTMPTEARIAILNVEGVDSFARPTRVQGEIIITRAGKTTGVIEISESNDAVTTTRNVTASLSGNTITVTVNARSSYTVTLTGNIYYYR